MALTLTELMVVPGTGSKRMVIWKVTGDGTSFQINVADLKMSKVEAAIVENVTNDNPIQIRTENYDYLSSPVAIIELGHSSAPLDSGGVIILMIIGY
jgi:hypothetical protein